MNNSRIFAMPAVAAGGRLLAFIFLLALAAATHAQTSCIPFSEGGAYHPGPPQWFQASATSGFARFNTWVDDPRWSGSSAIDFGAGSTPELQFRAMYHPAAAPGQHIYLSWWQKAALVNPSTQNVLYVGLRENAATTGLLLRINATTISPVTASASDRNITVHVVDAQGNFGSALVPTPAWANDARIWIEQVTDQATQLPAGTNITEPNNWALHVRIPFGQNLGNAANVVTLGATFNMWFELLQGTPAAPVIAYTWPRATATTSFTVTTPGGIEKLPPTSDWQPFALGGLVNNPPCQGVSISGTDIRVTYPGSPSDHEIHKTQVNTFSATPVNSSGGALDSGAIRARFRIANWGLQPNSSQADPTSGNWNTVVGMSAVAQAAGTSIANGSQWNITANRTLSNAEPTEAGFFNGTKSAHQCIQVELTGDANVSFLRSSAFRNMQVVPASVFSDTAEVSVVGLADAATPQRDVYLFVQKSNMPATVAGLPGDKPKPPDDPNDDVAGVPPDRDPATGGGTADGPPTGNAQAPEEQAAERERDRANELSAFERRSASDPTYIVHGYYDTGERMKIGGQERPVLEPMVAFGYFVDHQGELTGWDTTLGGAQKLADDFYRLSVDNDGVKPIQIRIEAKGAENGIPWLWLLIALIVLLFLIWLIKRLRSA